MSRLTSEVTLPVSGKVAVLQEGDGYTERALLRKNKKIYQAIPYYLAAMTVELDGKKDVSEKDILDLLVPDQEALLIEAYRTNYGDEFSFTYVCQECGKESEILVRLNEIEFRELGEGLSGPDPIVSITLPRTKQTAEVGCLTGKQESILMDLQAKGEIDLNQADFQSLRTLDGKRDFSYEDAVKLPLADHKAIRNARKKLLCGYDSDVSITCPQCDAKEIINIFMQRDFLFSG